MRQCQRQQRIQYRARVPQTPEPRAPLQPLGTRPAYPAEEPPYQPLVPCYKQALPNFNGPLSQGPADGNG